LVGGGKEMVRLREYMDPTPRHKVFVSYHHYNDEYYKVEFIDLFSKILNGFISKAVEVGDINPMTSVDSIRNNIRDNFIRDASVTVVLVGTETWKRKHIDWEISGSIRQTKLNSRCGLLGILLPSHTSFGNSTYDGGIVPPRLVKNQECGFAKIYDWTQDVTMIKTWIHKAYERRKKIAPDNSYPHFKYNKSGARWKE
jgi:hypothetical protein